MLILIIAEQVFNILKVLKEYLDFLEDVKISPVHPFFV